MLTRTVSSGVLVLLLFFACAISAGPVAGDEAPQAGPTVDVRAPEVPAVTLPFTGKAFRSESWCFEVHPEGGVVLWDQDPRGPKVGVFGTAVTAGAVEGAVRYAFDVERIARGKWISRCREEVVSAADLPEYEMGSVMFEVGKRAEVRVEGGDSDPRLCIAETCIAARLEELDAPQ